MRAEVLGHLVQQLGIERLFVAGGSGGARDSIVFTMLPEEFAASSIAGFAVEAFDAAGSPVDLVVPGASAGDD